MTRIVTCTYRYKPPPKRRKPVVFEVPVVVKAATSSHSATKLASAATKDPKPAIKIASSNLDRPSAIVTTISRKMSRIMRRDRLHAAQRLCAG
jgi:hypothetical protein